MFQRVMMKNRVYLMIEIINMRHVLFIRKSCSGLLKPKTWTIHIKNFHKQKSISYQYVKLCVFLNNIKKIGGVDAFRKIQKKGLRKASFFIVSRNYSTILEQKMKI